MRLTEEDRKKYINSLFEIYPMCRKLVFDTFDKKKYGITRTQQVIMLTLNLNGTLTMSGLASKINTSNEQATRAVAQLVEKGFIERMHDAANRRIIKIKLTDEAVAFVEQIKKEMHEEFLEKFTQFSDDELSELIVATNTIAKKLKKLAV
ncbi:MAG: MarR family transcriptional regulator [Ruminococcus sp.]|nr:MarR family transcriptional regulator [Ruminococcus sp.]